VHTGKEAAASARAIRARAYTASNEIVFGEDQYAPDSVDGRMLLAHELAHVMQQPRAAIARVVTANYATIRSDLTYGVFDWAITEAESDEVLRILTILSPEDLEDTARQMQREGLVSRLMENVSPTSRIANATLLQRVQDVAQAGGTGGSAPAVPAAGGPLPEEANRAPGTFDPCLVDVYALTNAGLLSYYQRALTVVNQGRDAPGYFDNRNLQRRLITERDRRVALGHAWLATMPETIPQTLRQILDGAPGSFQVLEVPAAAVAGLPEDHSRAPLMTGAQFEHFLETHDVERVDLDTYRIRTQPATSLAPAGFGTIATVGGGLFNTPFDAMVIDPYGMPVVSANGRPIMKWMGRLGEAGFSSQATGGFGMLYEDTNARPWVDRNGTPHTPAQEAYPGFDFDRPRSPFAAQVLGVQRINV
jgi:hypothetical protein